MSKKYIFFDGAMGTMLQSFGLKLGKNPEILNIDNPGLVKKVHELYINAGCDFITTNTFGANRARLENEKYSANEIVHRAVEIAGSIVDKKRIALSIGPTGEYLVPRGKYTDEEFYEFFSEAVTAGKNGVGIILIETMYDLKEAGIAIKAAHENSDLPVYCTFTFEDDKKTFLGYDAKTIAEFLNEQDIEAMGINCSEGPGSVIGIAEEMHKHSKVPIIVQPNAGLPEINNGKAIYRISPEEFAQNMKRIADLGVSILGGCCGTTPEHIQAMRQLIINS